MALPRRIDPLNPAGSLGPPRLGQGVRGGLQGISRNLIDPLNPAGYMNPARRAPAINPLSPTGGSSLDQKWNQFASKPNPQLSEFLKRKSAALHGNFVDFDKAQQLTDKDINDLRRMGIDKDLIPLIQDVVKGKRQFGQGHATHRSMLTEVSRTLGAIEATGAGFFHGTEEYQKKEHYKGRLLDYISHPARIYKELGAGFSEVPTAVRKGYNYGDLIRDTTDKNSLAHKFALPIGLGASVLFDPTTYLSFGATSASKLAAYHILAEADKAASVRATKLVSENLGKQIPHHGGGTITANWHNYSEIKNSVKMDHGAPWTLGDALEQLKYQGLQQKDQIRRTKMFTDPKTGITAKATARQRAGATLLPNNVLGGRGMRLGGQEVPGTARLGAKLSGTLRAGQVSDSIVGRTADAFGEALIPDWAARHVMQDSMRASAAIEGARIKSTLQKAQTDIGRTIREMQRPIMDAVDDGELDNVLHSLAPDEVKAFTGAQPKRVLVRPEARRGILDMTDDSLDGAQLVLKGNINRAVEAQIEGAVKAGLPRSGVTKLWDDLAKHYDDPLRALAEFTFKSTARSLGKQWAKQIVEDPRFALPMKPILEEQRQVAAEAAAAAGKLPKKGVTVHPHMLDEAPAGYTEFAMGNQRWAVHDSMIDALRDITNPTRLDGGLRRGFKRMNIVQDWWKLYATSPNPAFHVMNMIGAMWNNALAHVYNPGDYFDSMSYIYRARKEEAAQQGAKFGVRRSVPESTIEGRQAQNIMSEAEARSGLGRSSFLFGDVTRGHFTPAELAMSDRPLSTDAPMMQQFAEGGMATGKNFVSSQLTPVGGFREAPSVVHSQVQQSAQHASIPAPVELTHPAMIPDPTAELTQGQKDTIGAVFSRHFHGAISGQGMDPTLDNVAYLNQLQGALSPDVRGMSLNQIIDELKVGKTEGLTVEGAKFPKHWNEFHDAVIADLTRLTKEQKVQYIPPRFPDAPFKTPGELAAPGQMAPLYRPTAEQIDGGAKYFPVVVDKEDPTKIYVGGFEDTQEDVLLRWGVKHADDPMTWMTHDVGYGTFAPDGSIEKVNIGADLGEDVARNAQKKAEEVYAKVSDKRVARRAPSIQDLAGDKPYLSYFRVYQDPKNPDHVIAGLPGDDHYEVADELGLNPDEVKDWYQGTGVFDPDTGKIANVSIVREGNDVLDQPAILPENENELSERAMAAAREIYGETGAKTVSQTVPEQLVTKGKLRKGAIARTYGVTIPRKVAGTALLATGNPIGFMAFMPEFARAGRRLSGTIEDMVRLAPFLKYSENKQIAGVLREFGPINAAMMDIDYKGFSKADQQIMYDIGANVSRMFQFDYSNLTNFERYVAKSIFPFWTYYKNNLALQVQQAIKQPKYFGIALKTMNYINDNGENYSLGPWQEILPSYFQNLMAFQVPVPNSIRKQLGLPANMPLFLNPKMPFLSINLIPNLWDILRDPTQTTPQNLREIIAPVAGAWGPFSAFPLGIPGTKILLEAGTGYNLGLDRPIDWRRVESGDTQEAYTQAPPYMKFLPDQLNKYFGLFKDPKTNQLMISQTGKYIVEQMTTPFINNLGSSIPFQGGTEEDVQRQKADLVSWLTGVRLMPADVLRLNRNAAYSLLNTLEAKQDRLTSRGQQMPAKDLELLALVRADLKGIEATWDMREMDQEEEKNAP